MRVLVADDDEFNRDILKRMLTRLGAEAETAEDGTRAVELALLRSRSGRSFDLAFIDLDMPGLDGLAVARRLRASGPLPALVALTGSEEGPEVAAAGFDAFLQKPVTLEIIRAELEARGLKGPPRVAG